MQIVTSHAALSVSHLLAPHFLRSPSSRSVVVARWQRALPHAHAFDRRHRAGARWTRAGFVPARWPAGSCASHHARSILGAYDRWLGTDWQLGIRRFASTALASACRSQRATVAISVRAGCVCREFRPAGLNNRRLVSRCDVRILLHRNRLPGRDLGTVKQQSAALFRTDLVAARH